MLNRWEGIGNAGGDPDIRTLQNGAKNATFSVAITEKFKDAGGNRQERTEWVRCVAWSGRNGDGLAGVAERFIKKGSKVYVAGKLTTRSWTANDGTEQKVTEIRLTDIELLGDPGRGGGDTSQRAAAKPAAQDGMDFGSPQRGAGGKQQDFDDHIPF